MNWSNFLTHWKSTASGFLTIALITTSTLLGFPNVLNQRTTVILLIVQALAKAYIAVISQDAGTTLATTPGDPTPHAEPSHEVPDQPAARAVLPEVKK